MLSSLATSGGMSPADGEDGLAGMPDRAAARYAIDAPLREPDEGQAAVDGELGP